MGGGPILLPDVGPPSSDPVHPGLDHVGQHINLNVGIDSEAGLEDVGQHHHRRRELCLHDGWDLTRVISKPLVVSRIDFLVLQEVLLIRKEDEDVLNRMMFPAVQQGGSFLVTQFFVAAVINWPLLRLCNEYSP